jgi:hypothetical protein
MELEINQELLADFERQLDPRRPEAGGLNARVLGYGEISTVFEIGPDEGAGIAYKRMPIFTTEDELESYRWIFREYNRVLSEEVGIKLPPYGCAHVEGASGKPVMFLAQQKLDAASIGNKAIHVLPAGDVNRLIRQVLRELARVWRFNANQAEMELGIDGQVSNWAIEGFDAGSKELPVEFRLLYLDTSTPFIRLDGTEQLDPELFLRSAPSFLVWVLRALFLQDVMTRYYDLHLVAVDLIANFYKEQLPELIADLVREANDFFDSEAPELAVEPLTEKEIKSYYRQDALIWRLYLSMRKTDRFMRTRLSRRGYPYILPGKIKR